MSEKLFPIINVQHLNTYIPWCIGHEDKFYKDSKIIQLSKEIAEAFIEWGFIYLINHTIKQEVISNGFDLSRQFFKLNTTQKEAVLRPNTGENWGYVPFKFETFEKSRPFDLKECFNFFPITEKLETINKILPAFMPVEVNLFNQCKQLSELLLQLINMQLPVSDRNFLNDQHKGLGSLDENPTITRLLYYPPIKSEESLLENQLRCGEHSDYGTITLLFQDEVGGLQVVNPSGEYVNATPIPGSIVVNCGDMLELWSAGKFKSTRHRVLMPNDYDKARQSIAFFCHPDNNITVSCLDGSDKFIPQNPYEYLMQKFADTYG